MDPQAKEELFAQFVETYQKDFFEMVNKFETKAKPIYDEWNREDGHGHGLTCVVQDGDFFEKAGVNTSRITIPLSQGIVGQMKERKVEGSNFHQIDTNNLKQYRLYANGVSLVLHPINPFCPTVHANFRYLKVIDKDTKEIIDEWFGGGCDLTPIYLFEEDAQLYHGNIKEACIKAHNNIGESLYEKYKEECDKYFVNHHRKEARGIGGVFYDDFQLETFEKGMNFSKLIAYANLETYFEIINKRKDIPYTEENLRWKQYRRGRYVEFNLIHDRGTKFGLYTPDARIESILMSLPLIARWEYEFKVKEGSAEEKLVKVLRQPVKWA
ncbi:hypothetical protein pb186bvf_010734 [Paramecium bursaria]